MLVTVLFLDFGRALAGPDLAMARIDLQGKHFQKVIDSLSSELVALPRDGFLILADAYSKSGNNPMAIKTLNAALAKFKGDKELATALARAQVDGGNDKEAKVILRDVLERFPKYEPAYLVMADIYERGKNKYELRLLYQDLIEKVGEKPAYLSKVCELSVKQGHYDLANRYCLRFLHLDPKDPVAYVNMAMTYRETGQTQNADSYFKKAADSFSKSELAQVSYASFLDESKNYLTSYGYWKRATAADPQSKRAWSGLAFAALETQKFAESISAFEHLCELDKDAERTLRRAAKQLQQLKQEQWQDRISSLISKCDYKYIITQEQKAAK